MLIDLVILTDRATKTHRIAIVLVKDIQPRDRKGHLAKMTKLTGAINTGVKAPVILDALIRQAESPFTERVMKVRGLFRFKLLSHLGVYEGKTDPMDHLDLYKNLMMLQG